MKYDISSMGEIISQKRKEMGITQEGLAEILDVTPQAISKWERSGGLPDVSLLPDLALALGVSLDELFGHLGEGGDSAQSDFDFPNEFEGLKKAYELDEVACYSNLVVEKTVGVMVYFEDGSTANLGNGEIKFRTGQEIKLVHIGEIVDAVSPVQFVLEEKPETSDNLSTEKVQSEDSLSMDNNPLEGVDSVRIDSFGSLDFVIAKSPTNQMRWGAKNLAEIQERLEVRREDNTLVFTHRGQSGFGLFNIFNPSNWEDKTVRIEMPMDLACRLEYKIAGSGDLDCSIDFEEMDLRISGSGDINVARADCVDVQISGSGDFNCAEANRAHCKISGAGDIVIGEVRNELDISISGAGDARVDKGDLQSLALRISGAGDFDGSNVSTNYADIVLSGVGDAVIGRIKGESRERVSRMAGLTVHKRG